MPQVLIAGAGPTGLMLAAELALANVDVEVVERRATQELPGSRAGGLHARTLEVLDQRGVAERFVSAGQVHRVTHFIAPLDISDFPTRHNYVLALWQNKIERILADWVEELRVTIHRSCEVASFAQDDAGVHVALSDGRALHAQYLVGCDGGRSSVRKQAGIEFAGWDASTSYMIAEARADDPPLGFRGPHAIGKLDDGRVRLVIEEPQVRDGEPTLDELRATLTQIYGTDYNVHDVAWLSRFSDAARQASTYRAGRVLLAGDAAHVHSPVGGQGLNVGVQDAVNLGWKLARVVHGTSPSSLLDTYHAERHPVGARVLQTTLALTALRRCDDRTKALQELTSELLRMTEPRKRYGAMMSGLDIHYDLGAGHPLLGRRMPDLELDVGRVYTLIHDAQPVLLDFGELAPIAGVRHVRARYAGAWELPVLGVVDAPSAVLIRPDGHVAWVGTGGDDGLREAIARWFTVP